MATPKNEAPAFVPPEGVGVVTSPGGNQAFFPEFANFSGLATPFIDFQQAFDFATKLGEENRQKFFTNLKESSAAALDILRTDIAGIQEGARTLAPFAREQGRLDTAENIARAQQMSKFIINSDT